MVFQHDIFVAIQCIVHSFKCACGLVTNDIPESTTLKIKGTTLKLIITLQLMMDYFTLFLFSYHNYHRWI